MKALKDLKMKTTSINSIVRSGMIIITALSLAARGNTVKNNVNKVKGDTITEEDVAVVETPPASDITLVLPDKMYVY